jgi:hypothetical protein
MEILVGLFSGAVILGAVVWLAFCIAVTAPNAVNRG